MTKQEFIEYLGEHLTYEDIKKADAEAKAYVKGFKEGLEAKPEPQGEWIGKDDYEAISVKCSICGRDNGLNASNFCPNCGARMVK